MFTNLNSSGTWKSQAVQLAVHECGQILLDGMYVEWLCGMRCVITAQHSACQRLSTISRVSEFELTSNFTVIILLVPCPPSTTLMSHYF